MTNEKWEQFIETAQASFQNVIVTTEDMQDEKGEFAPGTIDSVEFTMPDGTNYKVIRENKPVVLEKKMHYSHRQGDTARSEYILSDTDFSHRVRVFKKDEDMEWEEIRADSLGL